MTAKSNFFTCEHLAHLLSTSPVCCSLSHSKVITILTLSLRRINPYSLPVVTALTLSLSSINASSTCPRPCSYLVIYDLFIRHMLCFCVLVCDLPILYMMIITAILYMIIITGLVKRNSPCGYDPSWLMFCSCPCSPSVHSPSVVLTAFVCVDILML